MFSEQNFFRYKILRMRFCSGCGTNSLIIGDRPNTASESTFSNTELSELFGPHRVLGRELSEFLSGYWLCAKSNLPSFFAELTELAAELTELSLPKQYSRNSIPPIPWTSMLDFCCAMRILNLNTKIGFWPAG